MKLLDTFKEMFSEKKFKKEKTESRKLPKGKKSGGKGVRVFVWTVLLLLIVAGPLGFLRANNALEKSKTANAQVQEVTDDDMSNQEIYDSPTFKVYVDRFVDDYVNIPQEGEERENYRDTLESYFVNEDFLPSIDFEGYRELTDKVYYGKEQEDDHVVAQYKVTYKTTPVNEDDEDDDENDADNDKESEQTVMLNIPTRYDDGFSVVEPVYFGDIPDLKDGDQEEIKNPYEEDNEDEMSPDKRNELKEWVEDFFSDYASKSEDDMAYMMDDPEALDDLQEFNKLDDYHAYEDGDHYIVKTNVIYKEPEIDITHQEPYTLKIKRMDGRYYVEELKQTLGGK